jgi:hypothetical protein
MPTEIHVAPDGDDGNEGTAESPLETLDAARDALRAADQEGATVLLHDGTYRREDSLVLEPQDSGRADDPITYRAAAGASPTISGGAPIDGWEPLGEKPPGLPQEAADEVYVADVPRLGDEPWTFSVLFDAAGALTRAHNPHRLHLDRDEEAASDHALRHELHVADGDPIGWSNLDDAELFCTPYRPWTVNYLPIDRVDEERRVIHTALPATYHLKEPHSWGDSEIFYRVENVFEGLTEPGRWVLDTDAERLYLWPRAGDGRSDAEEAPEEAPEDIVAPRTTELVKLAGNHDDREWVRNVRFEGITFTRGNRMRWGEDRVSLQHDWEQHDEPNGLLRLRGAEDCTVADCRFVESGSTGCRLDLHAVDCAVEHSEFARLGGSGIVLDGFGPGSRDENHHNAVRANHVHHVGELWWHSIGVFASQSGHLSIADNHVHDLPYIGIAVSGPRDYWWDGAPFEGTRTFRREEIEGIPPEVPYIFGMRHARHVTVEHNEVHDVVQRLGDGNGIYLSGTGESCTVRRNYVHDIEGSGTQAAIRLDADQYHSLVTENVVHRINGAGIIAKFPNQLLNNVIVGCYDTAAAVQPHITFRHGGPAHGGGIRRNVVVQQADDNRVDLVEFTDLLEQGLVDDNCYFSHAGDDHAQEVVEQLRSQGQGTRSIVVDPRVETADGGIAIPDDTPAREVGFRPFDEWGPREGPGPRTES